MAAKTKKKTVAKKTTTPQPAQGGLTLTKEPATAADVALAAKQAPSQRAADPDVSPNFVALLLDPALVTILRANAAEIDLEGGGTVEETLALIPDFVTRFQAAARLAVSLENLRASLTADNVVFRAFATAVAAFVKSEPKLSPLKTNKVLNKFLSNRAVQRGAEKAAKTKGKKAKAKKGAAAKTP